MSSPADQQTTNKAFKPSVLLKSISGDGYLYHEYTLGDLAGRFKKDDLNVKVNSKGRIVTVVGDNRQCKDKDIHFKEVLEVVSPDADIEKTSATYNSIAGTLTLKIPIKRTAPPTSSNEPQGDDNTNQPANETKEDYRTSENPKINTGKEKEQTEEKTKGQNNQNCRVVSVQLMKEEKMKEEAEGQEEEDKQDERVRNNTNNGRTGQALEKNNQEEEEEDKGYQMKNGRQLDVAEGGEMRGWRGLQMKKLQELSNGDSKREFGRWEDYREKEEMEVSVKGAIERTRKNKTIIFTAAIAFGVGFYLSHKLLGSSSSGGGGGVGIEGHGSIHSINATIVESYISSRCPCANDIKNSDV